jgi:hypothetical protein
MSLLVSLLNHHDEDEEQGEQKDLLQTKSTLEKRQRKRTLDYKKS